MQVENFKAYLANINVTVQEFSEILECHPTYLTGIMKGRYKPGKRLARDIRMATNGVIDLRPQTTDAR